MKTLFSGIRPSGVIHIGNYLGAIKNWVALQDEYKSIFCVVDMHAITTDFNPLELKENVLNTAIIYLSCGIDPKKSLIFIQSQVLEHSELAWVLECISPLGELMRMTQFKEKAGLSSGLNIKEETVESFKNTLKFRSINSGLLSYPCLMAADILLYKTNLVPVGEDQKQHLEFARMIAAKFNSKFGEMFNIPEPYIAKETKRIMSFDNPLEKMAKSSKSNFNYISLLDSPESIKNKIKKAVTDSGKEIKYDKENKPAISNMLSIMHGITNTSIKDLEKKYVMATYVEFKQDLAEELIKFLTPIQQKYEYYKKHINEVLEILENGRKEAKKIAEKTMKEVKENIGFI